MMRVSLLLIFLIITPNCDCHESDKIQTFWNVGIKASLTDIVH